MIRVFGTAPKARTPKGRPPSDTRRCAPRRCCATRRWPPIRRPPPGLAPMRRDAARPMSRPIALRLRLLAGNAGGAHPGAPTYTKAAAAEMAKRVFQRLAEWTTAAEGELDAKLTLSSVVPGRGEDRQAWRDSCWRARSRPPAA